MTARYSLQLAVKSRYAECTVRRYAKRSVRVVGFASGRTAKQAVAQAVADIRKARKAKSL